MNTPPAAPRTLVERYVLPPEEIERRSLAIVARAIDGQIVDVAEWAVAARVAYAGGDLALASAVRFSPGALTAGVEALRAGATVIADVRMLESGLDRGRLGALSCDMICAIADPAVAGAARASGLPRAVEAMRILAPRLAGAVVVIGNAPSALLALLDIIDQGGTPPALIVGMPVGFVAAAESKQELMNRSTPYITIPGSRGGSPLAAAALNALLRLAWPMEPGRGGGETWP